MINKKNKLLRLIKPPAVSASSSLENDVANTQDKVSTKKSIISIELLVAILLALCALGTAWSNWMSQLHASNEAQNYATSASIRSQAAASVNEASVELSAALASWTDLVSLEATRRYYEAAGNSTVAELYQNQIDYLISIVNSEKFTESAIRDALATGSTPNVFTSDGIISFYEDAQNLNTQAEELLQQGNKDNLYADAFAFTSVLYGLTMFILAAFGIIKDDRSRKILLIVAAITFIFGTIYMVSLPIATGFSFGKYFAVASS